MRKKEDAKFTCRTNSSISWKFNDRDLPLNVRVSGRFREIITIKGAVQANRGYYECVGTRDDGWTFRARGELNVVGMSINLQMYL